MGCTIYVAKTKALIGCAVSARLICAFVLHMHKAGFLATRFISSIGSSTNTEIRKIS